jgi:hypothetical protein
MENIFLIAQSYFLFLIQASRKFPQTAQLPGFRISLSHQQQSRIALSIPFSRKLVTGI